MITIEISKSGTIQGALKKRVNNQLDAVLFCAVRALPTLTEGRVPGLCTASRERLSFLKAGAIPHRATVLVDGEITQTWGQGLGLGMFMMLMLLGIG